ncbi:conserved protein of unknown function [Limnospira indica PCC 8005]|uniref:Uncharacterized protein n=1 Tax=Limnospira indica PCC 8005 TaxID=376219 RepID=A0A9P1KBD6_9CYAN|nr:conserved protein of unknown function [Limnospira indica PCC 8005]
MADRAPAPTGPASTTFRQPSPESAIIIEIDTGTKNTLVICRFNFFTYLKLMSRPLLITYKSLPKRCSLLMFENLKNWRSLVLMVLSITP